MKKSQRTHLKLYRIEWMYKYYAYPRPWICRSRLNLIKLRERLNLVRPDSFNELVNLAITQDDCITAHRAEKERKAPTGPFGAQPPRYRLVQNIVPKATQRNPSSGRWVFRPPQQQGVARPPMPQQQQSRPRPNFQQPNRGNGNNRCFTCGSPAHFARNCPQNQKICPRSEF